MNLPVVSSLPLLFAEYHLVVDHRPKFVFGVIFFGAVALFATRHAVASSKHLSSPTIAKIIGSSNPWVARSVCVLCAIVGWGAVALMGASLLGYGSEPLVRKF